MSVKLLYLFFTECGLVVASYDGNTCSFIDWKVERWGVVIFRIPVPSFLIVWLPIAKEALTLNVKYFHDSHRTYRGDYSVKHVSHGM